MYPVSFDAQQPELRWQAQEIVREVDHRPHLLVRLAVRGGYFPHRAAVPFVRIVTGERSVTEAWFTEITADSSSLMAYFAIDLPAEGVIEFGYEEQVLGRVPAVFDGKAIQRLDRNRLDADVVETTSEYLRKKRVETAR
jgi:hypothetical protein